jgi:hypothetical protein
MNEYEELKELAREADRLGDRQTASAAMDKMERLKGRPKIEHLPTAAIETAMALGSGAVAEPVAGLAGLASAPFLGGAGAGQVVQDMRQAMTYRPRNPTSQAVMRGIGQAAEPMAEGMGAIERDMARFGGDVAGPAGAAVGASIPTGLGLAIGGIPMALGHRAIMNAPMNAPARAPQTPVPPSPAPPVSQLAEQTAIARSMERQKKDVLAEAVKPDRAVLDAAGRLKIDLNPSHYSTNATYIELEQGLKSRPMSRLKEVEVQAITRIGEEAEKLVSDLGGSVDRTVFSAKLASDIDGSINNLKAQEGKLFDSVRDGIPRNTTVEAPNAKAYLEGEIEAYGGNKGLLSPSEKELLTLLNEKTPLTYAALDRIRKNIGEGYQRRGPYKDEAASTLDAVYGAISSDQLSVASGLGYGDSLVAANRLTKSRKDLEERSVALFGKDVQGSAAPKIGAAALALTKGDVSGATRLLQTVPNHLRQDAAVAILNDVFTSGARTRSDIGGGFATAYNSLLKHRGAMDTLLKELPEDARRRFDDIGKVASSVYKAKSQENVSKSARDIILAMDHPGNLSKLYDVGGKIAAAEGIGTALTGTPGIGTATAVASMLLKTKTPATQAADALLASPEFRNAIELAMAGNVPVANQFVTRSKAFKKWATTAPPGSLKAISLMGFIGWLTAQDEDISAAQ